MAKVFGIVGVLVLAAIARYLFGFGSSMPQDSAPSPAASSVASPAVAAATITMGEEDYEPSEVTMQAGDTVTFVNAASTDRWPASDIHPTHGIYPGFDPKRPVPPSESWSFTFERRGRWRWHDHLRPSITGRITVE